MRYLLSIPLHGRRVFVVAGRPRIRDELEEDNGVFAAYAWPMLQDLKQTELAARPAGSQRLMQPGARADARTLLPAGIRQGLLHISKLRVLCASRANAPSNPRASGTAAKMASDGTERARAGDVMVGTPNKVLEMTRGRGWNWDEQLEKEASMGRDVDLDVTRKSFYTKAPEMGLANADVMLEYTRMLLADIALARGVSVPFDPTSDLNPLETPNAPITYPFNLILTSATIPTMTRLASPHLHHLPYKVADLSEFLEEKGIKHVALAGGAEARKRGSNHHVDRLLRVKTKALAIPNSVGRDTGGRAAAVGRCKRPTEDATRVADDVAAVLSRGLNFAPDIKHVFIVDEPRNMIDFLHRAGRAGRAGEKGRGGVWEVEGPFQRAKDVRKKVGALKSETVLILQIGPTRNSLMGPVNPF
ncbi:hypothetical protein FIBSPDRAFT_916602 [Athelia psychrophila]|uniref:Helicase C-terminal domain-containing protein n=1 Tax=Athelia psychrophila TaxID=1759441 RepID=A0A166UT05_9AGAM|nr:hypothetical protein FIBSPDRAFT_916602 [Fibularhizoctonia sp. CBS 109695]